jgi:alkylhydroperoxidase family enzyme
MERKYFDEREYKVLEYAMKSAREASRITDKDFEEIKKLGYSNRELLEIQDTIANALYISNFADSLNNRSPWWYSTVGL